MEYFLSTDVHVFPCSYRSYNATTSKIYDPEARMMTEDNFRHSGYNSHTRNSNDTYILNYNTADNILEVVLGGYYFKISNFSNYTDYKYLVIQIVDKGITNDNTAMTKVLGNLYSGADQYLDETINNIDYFCGLGMATEEVSTSGYFCLQIFETTASTIPLTSSTRLDLPIGNLNASDEEIITKTRNQTITGNKTFTNNIVVNGNGQTEANANKVIVNVNTDLNAKTTISDAGIATATITYAGIETANIESIGPSTTATTVTLYSKMVNSNGKVCTVPNYTSGNANYILALDNNGVLTWRAPYEDAIEDAV